MLIRAPFSVTATTSQTPNSGFRHLLPLSKKKLLANPHTLQIKIHGKLEIVCRGMLEPRKFMQRKKKVEVFKDAADEANQKNWWKLMTEIDEAGSAVSI
ncbi:hypothetical protein GIB67_020183, partial [Kingdonia uniflora]